MKANFRIAKKILVARALLQTLAGCAFTQRSYIDVSDLPDQEFIEFDAQVDVPLTTAYRNILNIASMCWRSPFSGQILAYASPDVQGISEISFAVPGKFLGSKVELATIRLYPSQDGNRTQIVGSSVAYPGTWQLTRLADWANGVPDSCMAATAT